MEEIRLDQQKKINLKVNKSMQIKNHLHKSSFLKNKKNQLSDLNLT